MKKLLFCFVVLSCGSASGQTIITQWNFNAGTTADIPGGPDAPLPGIGTGALQKAGSVTTTFQAGSGSSDPEPTASNWSWEASTFPASSLDEKTAGITIDVSTVGFISISLKFDQRLSNTAANTWAVFYSTDVTASIPVWQEIQIFTFTPAPTGTGDKWYNDRTVDFSTVPGLENNAHAGFRIVSAFDPTAGNYLAARSTSTYATTGKTRFDMITVSGVPAVVITNEKPVASAVSISGIAAIGDSLKAIYTYTDAEGDQEDVSTYQWYRSDAGGINAVAIPGADTLVYMPGIDDLNKYLFIEVTPVAATGTSPGDPVISGLKGPVLQLGDPGVVKINEIYSRGEDTNTDPDLKADWIEFYNSGAVDVTLAGLQVCDGAQCQTLVMDSYSALIVPAGGFLALAEDATNSFTFGLSSLGERVMLKRANNAVIDSVTFPALEPTQSYGRHTDGTTSIKKLTPPTRGASNNSSTIVKDPITGLNETGYATQIYPVPARNELIVKGFPDHPIFSISLFSSTGREVVSISPEQTTTTISLAEWSSGLYLLRLCYKDGLLETRKIVKE